MTLEQPAENQDPVSGESPSVKADSTENEAAADIASPSTPPKAPEPASDPSMAETVEMPVAPPITSAETPTEEPTPVAEEATAPSATESAESTGAPTSEPNVQAQVEAPKPRVRLNPTVDPAQAKAVPSPTLAKPVQSEAPSAVPTESGTTDEEIAAAQAAQQMAAPATPAQPVEIPAGEDLDADVEAEIAAAISGEELAAVPVAASTPPADATAEVAAPMTEEDVEPGTKLKGRVQSLQKENILLDVGFRASAMVPLRQFEGRKQPQLGQELEIVVDRYDAEDGLLLASLPRMARAAGNWDEVAVDQVVDCMVKKSNKGGLEVTVSNLRGFLPASQVDLGYVENLDSYVGQKLTVKIVEVKPEKRNLVVSRRAFLQDERESVAQDMWQELEVGQTKTGKVKTIKDYGAFVDIGGIDGLLHVGELSWTRVNHPRDVLSEGQEVEVQVVGVDTEKKKISLSLKQMKQNPWDECVERFPVESIIDGKVTNVANFGAFVEIEEGVEGLIHISELDHRRVSRVTDVVKVGDDVQAKVVSIDPDRKRIGLSLKALKSMPAPPVKPKDEDLAPSGSEVYQRKRKGPLKGGTGGSAGPLFG